MNSRRRTLTTFCALAVACTSSLARANGRFPNALQLREPVPGFLVLSGTYGLLVSGNAGKDFQFVCESQLFGKPSLGSWLDPLLETLADGSVLSGSQNGLRVSHDRGCSFATAFELPHDPSFVGAGQSPDAPVGLVVDVCPGYADSGSAVALTTVQASDGSVVEHRLYETTDGARSWRALPKPIEKTALRVVLTVDVAPSRQARIYVSGSNAGTNMLSVSDDGGASYVSHPIALDDPEGAAGVYIAGVSPVDPERVYLRVSRRSIAEDGSDTWDDSLLVSDDGGAHFRDVLRRRAALLGFALSPDGTTVLAGFGDPKQPPVVTSDDALGLYAASSAELVFEQRLPNLSISCLRSSAEGLYVCAKENDPLGLGADAASDFHVGLFRGAEAPTQATPLTPILRLRDVRGPMPWKNATSPCTEEWEGTCPTLNACESTVVLSARAIECGVTLGSGGQPGNEGGASTNGGRSTTLGGASEAGGLDGRGGASERGGAATAGAGGASAAHPAGCACQLSPAGNHSARALALLGVVLVTSRRVGRKHTRRA